MMIAWHTKQVEKTHAEERRRKEQNIEHLGAALLPV